MTDSDSDPGTGDPDMGGDGGPVDTDDDPFPRFVRTVFVLAVVVFVGAAVTTPPDPISQLSVLGPGIVVAAALAYWLVYLDGFERLRRAR